MKKRILSLLLALMLCLIIVMPPVGGALAAQDAAEGAEAVIDNFEIPYSPWAEEDLIVGDTYGIYPMAWYQKDMAAPIKYAALRVLFAGVRGKLLDAGCMARENAGKPVLNDEMTVEEVLNAFYTVISGFEYSKDIGLTKKYTPAAFMEEYGIFTGQEGGLKLGDICSIEQACVIATRLVTYLYDTLDAASKGFLWETKYGGNTVYMLGSIHLASYDIYPFSETILEAYRASDAVAFELNAIGIDQEAYTSLLLSYAVYQDGTTLKDHVSEETYRKTIELAAKLGYWEELIAIFKPWYVELMFSSLSATGTGSEAEVSQAALLGIDMKFMNDAARQNKPILEIEGLEFQIQMMDSFSDELEEVMLNSTIAILNRILEGTYTKNDMYLYDLLAYWHDGNAEAFLQYIAPEYELPEGLSEEDARLKSLMEEYIRIK